MAKILITSGPTRQYLDPVRFLSNASSGRMGAELARAAIAKGHDVVIVSGPVSIDYPAEAEVISVVTTDDMLHAAEKAFAGCDGVIGAAAPCDYRPAEMATEKMKKTGQTLTIEMIETVDIMARLGQQKKAQQWSVGFALETEGALERAIANAVAKLKRKHCDLMVLNGAAAIESLTNSIKIVDRTENVLFQFEGKKSEVATMIIEAIEVIEK